MNALTVSMHTTLLLTIIIYNDMHDIVTVHVIINFDDDNKFIYT